MAYSIKTKDKAKRLRVDGYSYNYISDVLGVSKATLHDWLHDVPSQLNEEMEKKIGNARKKSTVHKSTIKNRSLSDAAHQAGKDIGTVSNRDLMMLALGLYIGEGSKSTGVVRMVNSDPEIIQITILWLTRMFNLTNENFTLAIHLYPDNNVEACLKHWAGVTGIPRSQFGKTQIDRRKGKHVGKKRKLPNGTAHLTVRGKGRKDLGIFLLRRILAQGEEMKKQLLRV